MITHHAHPKNNVGRDFIVGDLHGEIDQLVSLLVHVDFNKDVDRVFSVGDLVDRGLDSVACLRLTQEPWFFAVKGNHEQMFIDHVQYDREMFVKTNHDVNGGEWSKKLSERELQELCRIADDLPNMISVGARNGEGFHIVHSEYPVDSSDFEIAQGGWEQVLHMGYHQGLHKTYSHMWARDLFDPVHQVDQSSSLRERLVDWNYFHNPELSVIYCGHSILKGNAVKLGNHTNLDTGAYISGLEAAKGVEHPYGLTMIQHDTKEIFKIGKDNLIRKGSMFDGTNC